MKYMKIYYVPLVSAYKYSLIDKSLKNPREAKDNLRPHLYIFYNPEGKIDKIIEYFDGSELSTTINTYVDGKLTESEKIFYETGGTIITRFLYSESRIEKITETDGALESRQVRELFESGKVMEIVDYDADGDITSCREFDEQGNLIFSEAPGFCEEYKYTYDDEKRIVSCGIYNGDEKLISEEKYSYLLGKLHEITTYIDNVPVEKKEYLYGADDNVKWIRTLNMDGELLSEIELNASKEEVKHSEFINNKEVYTWERQDLEDMNAQVFLETRLNKAHTRYHGPKGAMTAGKREVVKDDQGRPKEELLINYVNRNTDLNLSSECYYVYEYGEE
ncbi:MAG: hypothetical protein JXJ04_08230 [Spirochaetales bacterium]|nr:hypothetical protein [Spirochaetales bacterium]